MILITLLPAITSCEKENIGKNTGEVAVTAGVTDIGAFSAVLIGYANLTGEMTEETVTYGFDIARDRGNLEEGFATQHFKCKSGSRDDKARFECKVDGLTSNTVHYYRAYLHFKGETHYGKILSFTTTDLVYKAYTDDAVVKSPGEVELRGHVSFEGDEPGATIIFMYGNAEGNVNTQIAPFVKQKGNNEVVKVMVPPAIGVTYYYKMRVNLGTASNPLYREGEVKSFTVEGPTSGKEVDLGTGVKWGSCNVGASSPEGTGTYYAWGETSGRNSYPLIPSYTSTPSVLPASNDAATANLGSSWRMPTSSEANALISGCNAYWATYKGVTGRIFVSKSNKNSIFLPAAGYWSGNSRTQTGENCYYWTSSPAKSKGSDYASALFTGKGEQNAPEVYDADRARGMQVRAVKK